ncbi:MAG: hypothetical protein ACYDIA_01740 [Candidatus Humimicrobiaceae bacterium]
MNDIKPKTILNNFLKAYYKKDWETMAKLSQITWASNCRREPVVELEKSLGNILLLDYKVGNFIYNEKDMSFDIPYTATFKLNLPDEKAATYQCSAMVIKEEAPYKPNIKGQWGVNPISMLRRKLINIKDEVKNG